MKKIVILLVLIGLNTVVSANQSFIQTDSSEQERIYLVQLVNQINAMLPIIRAAEKQKPEHMRMQFHYSAYQDVAGKSHNGLLEDVLAIRHGIEEKLNTITLEPRVAQPIRGDYLDKEKNHVG